MSFGSKVRPGTVGCVAMGSVVLFIFSGCVAMGSAVLFIVQIALIFCRVWREQSAASCFVWI